MKLALALLLIAVPALAQQEQDQKIVYNVVVNVVTTGAPPVQPPAPPPVVTPPPPPPPPPTTTPPPTPPPTPAPIPEPTPAPGSCVSHYFGAAGNINVVSAELLQAQQLLAAALSSGSINASGYNTGTQVLAQLRLDNGDVRDLVRIASPKDVVAKNITFIGAEIATLPGLLGSTPALKGSLVDLNASMQASLGQASTLISNSVCAQAVP